MAAAPHYYDNHTLVHYLDRVEFPGALRSSASDWFKERPTACCLWMHTILQKASENGLVSFIHPQFTTEDDALLKWLESHDEILDQFTKAIHSGEWKQFCDNALFKTAMNVSPSAMEDLMKNFQQDANQHAWLEEYQGNARQLLQKRVYNAVNNKYFTDHPYTNQMSVIQGSGMGNSRLVDELAKYLLTFPFNLRPNSANQRGAFPPPDEEVRNALLKTDSTGSQTRITQATRYLLFFFTLLRHALATMRSQELFSRLPARWREYLLVSGDNRDRFYKEVVRDFETDYANYFQTSCSPQGTGENTAQLNTGELPVHEAPSSLKTATQVGEQETKLSEEARQSTEVTRLVQEQLDQLQAHLQAENPAMKVHPIVFYFDEAHALHDKTTGDHSTLYNALCTAFDRLRAPAFAIFLSTRSNLSQFAPPASAYPSDRAILIIAFYPHLRNLHSIATLNPSILTTPQPWKLYTQLHSCGDLANPCELLCSPLLISRLTFIQRFWAYSKHLTESPTRRTSEKREQLVMDFAMHKLLNSPSLPRSSVSRQRIAVELAVLSIRILVELESVKDSNTTDYESILVENHMRMAYSIPQHCDRLYSGYSSEPILAEAAARIMGQMRLEVKDMRSWDWAAHMLLKHVRLKLVTKGELGEFTGRFVLIGSMDDAQIFRAIERKKSQAEKSHKSLSRPGVTGPEPDSEGAEQKSPDTNQEATNHQYSLQKIIPTINWSEEISLLIYVKHLVGEKNFRVVMDSLPDNVTGQCFEDEFEHSVVRFTHFARAKGNITLQGALAAFLSGAAILSRPGQPGFDAAIPFLKDRRKPISLNNIGLLIVSWKNVQVALPAAQVAVDAAFVGCFKGDETARPYIVLIQELDVQRRRPTTGFGQPEPQGKPRRTKPKAKLEASAVANSAEIKSSARINVTPIHPRYTITIRGCTEDVYGIVKDPNVYAQLLKSCSMLGEHGYQDDESISALKELKPWSFDDQTNCRYIVGGGWKQSLSNTEPVYIGVEGSQPPAEMEKDTDDDDRSSAMEVDP